MVGQAERLGVELDFVRQCRVDDFDHVDGDRSAIVDANGRRGLGNIGRPPAVLTRPEAERVKLVVGVSRKSFLGKLIGSSEMSDRLAPTIALTATLRGRGADIIRVHDVNENVAALRAAEALLP